MTSSLLSSLYYIKQSVTSHFGVICDLLLNKGKLLSKGKWHLFRFSVCRIPGRKSHSR